MIFTDTPGMGFPSLPSTSTTNSGTTISSINWRKTGSPSSTKAASDMSENHPSTMPSAAHLPTPTGSGGVPKNQRHSPSGT